MIIIPGSFGIVAGSTVRVYIENLTSDTRVINAVIGVWNANAALNTQQNIGEALNLATSDDYGVFEFTIDAEQLALALSPITDHEQGVLVRINGVATQGNSFTVINITVTAPAN